jgi:uroporphyrinogen decarboxylase
MSTRIIKNDRFLRALARKSVDRTPVWMMRQAGRYLPEYRKLRGSAGSFLNLCKNPELACEVSLQPLKRFDLDAAIIFSDILTVPDALGLGLYFQEGEGPAFHRPLLTVKDIDALRLPFVSESLGYVFDAIRLLVSELKGRVPVIGFCGSPWTVATYMLKPGPGKDQDHAKRWRYKEPAALHRLLQILTTVSISYLEEQAAAGAECLMIFDTWGSVLSHQDYLEFSLAYMKQMVEALSKINKPVILFTKGGGLWLEAMVATGCTALGLDWTCSLGKARILCQDKVALQGNLDPIALSSSIGDLKPLVSRVLADYGYGHGHIFNLGHGISPDMKPENVQAMIELVATLSPHYHQEQ